MYAFGDGTVGQLGIPQPPGFEDWTQDRPFPSYDTPKPVGVTAGVLGWAAVSTGEKHTCAISSNGSLYCYGLQQSLGIGPNGQGLMTARYSVRALPTLVAETDGVTSGWVAVSAGEEHTCAISSTDSSNAGGLYCWGRTWDGKLGIGPTSIGNEIMYYPTPVVSDVTGWTAVSVGNMHTCAIASATILCMGNGLNGQLGTGSPAMSLYPKAVAATSGVQGWAAVSAGAYHNCAISMGGDGKLFCWGYAERTGTLNPTNYLPVLPPTAVAATDGMTLVWAAVAAGPEHTCGIASTGALLCWGEGSDGQLGYGDTTRSATPRPVAAVAGVSSWAAVSVGGGNGKAATCAIAAGSRAAFCTGRNFRGQLGIGPFNTGYREPPVLVLTPVASTAGVLAWAAVSASGSHTALIPYSWDAFPPPSPAPPPRPHPPKPPLPPLSAIISTAYTSNGGTNVTQLALHNAVCANSSAISYAKLSASSSSIRYELKCQKVYTPPGSLPTVLSTASTTINANNNNNTLSLTSHKLNCPAGAAMRQFQLRWSWELSSIWYAYECLVVDSLPTGGACVAKTTAYAASGGNTLLASHTLDCTPSGKLLTAFGLEREASPSTSTRIRYTYTCC